MHDTDVGNKSKYKTFNETKICLYKDLTIFGYISGAKFQNKIAGKRFSIEHFKFEFPCIISSYHIKNQQDATLAVLFISNCKITLHVSDASCVHHQEY